MILGYRLYADTGRNDALRLIYDGSSNPQISEFNYTSVINQGIQLDTRLYYRF